MLETLSGRLPCLTSLKHRVSQHTTPPSPSKRLFFSLTTSARHNTILSTHGNILAHTTAHLRALTQFNSSVQHRSISVLDSSLATSSKPLIMFGKANEAYQKSQSISATDPTSQATNSQQTTLGGKPVKRIGSGSFKTNNALSRAQPGPWTKPSTVSNNPLNRTPLTNGSSNRQHSSAGSVASDTSLRSSVLQSGGFKRALSGASSFTSAPTIIERPPSPNLNDMEKLRQAVYFDENDFDFDDDLSFDFEADDKKSLSANSSTASSRARTSTPQINSSISSYATNKEDKSAAISKLAYVPPVPVQAPAPSKTNSITGFAKPVPKEWYAGSTKLPSPVQPKTTQESSKDIPSSMTIPWSSSPPEHHQPLTSRTQANAQSDRKRASPNLDTQKMEPPAKKGRTLPWVKEQEEARKKEEAQRREEEARLAALKMKEQQKYPMGFKEERLRIEGSLTKSKLAAKTPAKKVQPWDMTASAVKVAQKDIKASKKLSTIIADKLPGPKKIKGSVAPLFLSQEQRHVIDMVLEGKKSVFFTGSAGTGKSVLLRELIAGLKRRHARDPDRIAVTASTGLAACNIGGITLHSFAGIGLGRESVDQLVKKIKRNNKAKTRWLRTKVLIIDEISMVDGDLFDKLEGVARSLKNNGRPFGGIQLVVTGDFFQLPPVPDGGKLAKFSFEANTWNTSVDHTIGLTQIFRQKDPVFAGMLNEMRLGKLSQASIEAFRKLSRPIKYDDGLEATELFPTRHEVENANATRLSQLQGEGKTYSARDESKLLDPQQRDKLLSNVMAPPSLTLKINAQVMLIKNIDDTLVNGSLGRVVGFMDEKTYAMATENGTNLLEVEDEVDDDEDTKLKKAKIRDMASSTGRSDTSHRMPLVQFSLPDGTARQTLLQFESWKIELPTGEVQASRTQLPLILAWAISIHKAQGQTLERVKVDLGKVFEKGQAYVALSRATSQNGLQIMRFDPKRVMAHDKVRSFYESLYSVDRASEVAGSAKKSYSNLSEEEQALLEAQREIDQYALTTGQAGRMRAYA